MKQQNNLLTHISHMCEMLAEILVKRYFKLHSQDLSSSSTRILLFKCLAQIFIRLKQAKLYIEQKSDVNANMQCPKTEHIQKTTTLKRKS